MSMSEPAVRDVHVHFGNQRFCVAACVMNTSPIGLPAMNHTCLHPLAFSRAAIVCDCVCAVETSSLKTTMSRNFSPWFAIFSTRIFSGMSQLPLAPVSMRIRHALFASVLSVFR